MDCAQMCVVSRVVKISPLHSALDSGRLNMNAPHFQTPVSPRWEVSDFQTERTDISHFMTVIGQSDVRCLRLSFNV